MHSKIRMRVVIAALSLISAVAWAGGRATPDEAKVMAVKAAAYLKSVGPQKAFAAFDQKSGPWHDRDLYVTVEDNKGVMVAHGTNPGLIGMSVLDLRDVTGKPFNHAIQAIKTAGWVTYQWQDPLTKTVRTKKAYEVRVGEYIIGVGAYVK